MGGSDATDWGLEGGSGQGPGCMLLALAWGELSRAVRKVSRVQGDAPSIPVVPDLHFHICEEKPRSVLIESLECQHPQRTAGFGEERRDIPLFSHVASRLAPGRVLNGLIFDHGIMGKTNLKMDQVGRMA